MRRTLVVCLALVSGCTAPGLDVGSNQSAIKPVDSCDHVSCKPHHDDHDPKRAQCCESASAVINGSGGTVTTADGTSVEVPLGAVAGDTAITIHESDTPAPKGAVTPVIAFGPDGTVFAHPVKVTIPLARATTGLTTFWTKHDGSGQFEPIGGTVVGDNMIVEVTHFSEGYVAADPGVRTITGTESTTWVGNPTQIVYPDLSALVVEALIPDGSGGYTSIAGSGTSDGLFTITNVPVGPAIVHTGNLFTTLDVTTDTDVDLSQSRLGRPDAIVASDASRLVFEVGNMTAWQDGDSMEFFCPQNNDWIFGLEIRNLDGFPVAGDTSIEDMIVPEPVFLPGGGALGNLIDSAHDTCSLLHMQTRPSDPAGPDGPVPYLATIEAFNPAPFDQLDGQDTLVSGAFSSAETPNSISVDLQMQKYVQNLGAAPAGTLRDTPGASFYISGLFEDASGVTAAASSADFLGLDVTANPVETIAYNMHYGLTLAGRWRPFGSAGYGLSHAFPVPGTPRAAVFSRGIFTEVDVSNPVGVLDIEPRLGAPRTVQIAGLDVLQPQSGVGVTPTISWQAPTLGTPNLYIVDVFHLTPTPNRRNFVNVARIATTATSFTLPAGVLTSGEPYVISVQAGIAKTVGAQSPTVAPFNADISDGANVLSTILYP